jgi:hypothetical protein
MKGDNMNDILDMDKEVAQKLLLRIMEPIRKKLFEAKDQGWTDNEEMGISLGTLKEMDSDLGALGLTLANRYREQTEFRTALSIVASENVRMTGAVSALSELLEAEKNQSQTLAEALEKSQETNATLNKGFKSNSL